VPDVVRPAVAAISFLTAAPVGRRIAITDRDLRRGVMLFPVVGAVVGASTALVAWAAAAVFPDLAASIIGVATGIAATAALHLDGLADTADGVGASIAGRDPLPAMGDPRLGTWGGTALALDLLLRVIALSALLGSPGFPWAAIAAGSLSRMSIVGLAWAVPYGGPDEGTGVWTRELDRRRCLGGLGIGAGICFLTVGLRSLVMAPVAIATCIVIGRWSARHLSGMRGDTFGAAAEMTETLALTVAIATV
jgi:adenosylcobinamide-GDP ribazoletransferase